MMLLRSRSHPKNFRSSAFTLIELMIVVVVVAILAGLVSFSAVAVQKASRDTARETNVKVISTALEKYYRKNGEYPSVAFMTSQDITAIKQKLDLVSTHTLKLPLADDATKNSIVTSDPSSTRLLYLANTSDSAKNTQCQTDVNGYCDGFTLQYKKEADGSMVAAPSLHDTFTPLASASSCAEGETQSGNTCTKTYAATMQSGGYTCPNGGTLTNTTCTSTYTASYSSGGGYYSCSSGSLSGSSCVTTTTSSYGASQTQNYCKVYGYTTNTDGTTHQYCQQWVYSYSCPSGGSLSGSTCTVTSTSSSPATYYSYPGSYYCNSGDGSPSGTTCTHTYTATQGSNYYTCPSGGSVSGSTCTYSYTLP